MTPMNKIFRLIFMVLLLTSISSICNAANLGNALGTGYTLWQDDYLMSQNGKYILKMQTDGSLVLYRLSDGKALYSMAKHGQFAVMQTDGNFVEYASNGNWLWATHTNVSTGEKRIALLRDDGSLVISCQLPLVVVYWSSGADPDVNLGAVRYPMIVTNLGTPPAAPSMGTIPSDYWVPPDQVIVK
jgi:hypothetical protein